MWFQIVRFPLFSAHKIFITLDSPSIEWFKIVQICKALFQDVQTCTALFRIVQICTVLFQIVLLRDNLVNVVQVYLFGEVEYAGRRMLSKHWYATRSDMAIMLRALRACRTRTTSYRIEIGESQPHCQALSSDYACISNERRALADRSRQEDLQEKRCSTPLISFIAGISGKYCFADATAAGSIWCNAADQVSNALLATNSRVM